MLSDDEVEAIERARRDALFSGAARAQWTVDNADRLIASHRAQAAEIKRLREALTPGAETKAAYMGEFQFRLDDCPTVNVPWTTIKQIMAAIRARAALFHPTSEGGE